MASKHCARSTGRSESRSHLRGCRDGDARVEVGVDQLRPGHPAQTRNQVSVVRAPDDVGERLGTWAQRVERVGGPVRSAVSTLSK